VTFIDPPNVFNPAIEGESKRLHRLWSEWLVRLAMGLSNLPVYANNAAALAGGVRDGGFYRTGGDPDVVCVAHI
jgi:hypothetical protein